MEKMQKIRIFEGATAIITGGASGIGRALAEELAGRGAKVVLADLQIELAQDVAAEIRASGGQAEAEKLDVTDFSAVQNLVKETVQHNGRLDYMFNNAGVVIGGTADQLSIEDWNKVIGINFNGVVNGVEAAYKVMAQQGFGHIVNTASMAGIMPNPLNVVYAATKHAIVGLSQSLRIEAAHLGVRVSVICPGVVRTPILAGGEYGAMYMKIPPERLSEIWEELKPMSPNIFAKKVLTAVAKNKAIIIIPQWWKLIWWLNRLSPALGLAFAGNRFNKMKKEFDLL